MEHLTTLYTLVQVFYLLTFLVMLYFFTRNVNWVDTSKVREVSLKDYPYIILLYPVLKEPYAAMETAMTGLAKLQYSKGKYIVLAIPNANDELTVAYLRQLEEKFDFLQILEVPPTTDETWDMVWEAWESNPKVYWWHQGRYAKDKDLPPKKTRQLIYAFYALASTYENEDFLIDYIDADSVPPPDHFLAAVSGMQYHRFDVLQATNIAGNMLQTWAATFHALDHLIWDRFVYPHMSADGQHPFWVLGKGLFYWKSDLLEVGGFNPHQTIEDPEIGMKLYTNGRRIGIIENPLIEEVPITWGRGVTQRKRWICGFFQAVESTKHMGMKAKDRFLAHLNLIPVLSLLANAIGLPLGVWALLTYLNGNSTLPNYLLVLSAVNVLAYCLLMVNIYRHIWLSTGIVLKGFARVHYMLRVNPIFMWAYWLWWIVSIVIGYRMYQKDLGREWERTVKIDPNRKVVRSRLNLTEAELADHGNLDADGVEVPVAAHGGD